MAALDERHGLHPNLSGLRYYYHAERKTGTVLEDMEPHSGLARLLPKNRSWSVLEGDFFNDQGYQRWGAYHLKRSDDPIEVERWLADTGRIVTRTTNN